MQADVWSEKKLGYLFHDVTLLERALTHRSYSTENNERLEFLGDAVLGEVIARVLYEIKPLANEGSLSRFRAGLVRGETLAVLAAELELGDVVRLGSGEQRTGGYQRQSVLANALEAVFGAVFLDGGYEDANRVIRGVFTDRLSNLPDELELKDPKTRLQEWLQARQMPPPEYELLNSTGSAHEQVFQVTCRIDAMAVSAEGTGTSRRRAEQVAAGEILQQVSDDK